MQKLLLELLEEFHDKINQFDGSTWRQLNFPSMPNKIMVAVGMRRTGKTYFLLQTIKALLKKKTPISHILYLNFEDDRLYPLTQDKLSTLIDGFYKLYPENHNHICYLFLDEIQNIEQWPLVIRRYFDTKKTKIYLTGSSAKLLSKEIATSLRGRSIATEVWPFSFSEYLSAKQVAIKTKVIGKKTIDQLIPHFVNYLNEGGFPETVLLNSPDRIRILQDYVDVVIFRDIIERYNITNLVLIKYMVKIIIKNTGTSFSVNKFYNDLKSQGFTVGKTTIHDYLSYIEDAYVAFTVPLYSESIRKIQTNPKKIYAIDPGLVNAYTMGFAKNMGHLFENVIYLDLRRRGDEVYYYLTNNRYEVDFLTKDRLGKWHLYQVVWDYENKETLEREVRALKEAEKELNIKGQLITPESYLTNPILPLNSF